MTIWYILLAILGLSVLVITHELGHYLMGKWLGFTITEFSVGLGPKIFGIKGRQTEFTLRALPIGGSCRFFGEDGSNDEKEKIDPKAFEDGETKDAAEEPKKPDERLFSSKPAWKRFLVVLAGPVMNILTCTLICFVLLLAYGTHTASSECTMIIDGADEGTPAYEAGVLKDDIPVAVNGQRFTDDEQFRALMNAADLYGMDLTVLRGASVEQTTVKTEHGEEKKLVITGGTETVLHFNRLTIDDKTGDRRLGVTVFWVANSYTKENYSVGRAALMAFPETWDMGKLVYESLGMILSGRASCRDVTGIVGTVDAISDTMAQSQSTSDAVQTFLWLMALIAVNLGIVNLLPLPALDGGRLIFIIIEMIRRKPVPPEKEGMVHLVGMILLLALMLALTVSDVVRCFGG
jgi:regulator of sigma E protease